MLTRYCPACWAENHGSVAYCKDCGAALAPPAGESYIEMLSWALEHPRPEVRLRAASFLGRLGTRATPALPHLFQVFRRTEDVYLRAEIARALGEIGGEEAGRFLLLMAGDPSVIVRLAAVKTMTSCCHRLPPGLRAEVATALRQLSVSDPSPSVRELAH